MNHRQITGIAVMVGVLSLQDGMQHAMLDSGLGWVGAMTFSWIVCTIGLVAVLYVTRGESNGDD